MVVFLVVVMIVGTPTWSGSVIAGSDQQMPVRADAPGQTRVPDPKNQPMSNQSISVAAGRLSVSLVNAPFRDVMASIARQSGIEIRVLGEQDLGALTDSFENLTLRQGLGRLLQGGARGHLFKSTKDQDLAQVFVLADEGQQSIPPAGAPRPALPAAGLEALKQHLEGLPADLREAFAALAAETRRPASLPALQDAQGLHGDRERDPGHARYNPVVRENILRQLRARYPQFDELMLDSGRAQY